MSKQPQVHQSSLLLGTDVSKKVIMDMKNHLGKLRPQIFLAITVLGVLAVYGVTNAMPEIATGTVGGIIALGMKVLENE